MEIIYKKLIFIIILIAIIFISYNIYNNYYYIDTSNHRFVFLAHLSKSPDEEHRMSINIYKENEESNIAYIMVNIHKSPYHKTNEIKTILWQEVQSNNLKYVTKDGTAYDYWVDNFWVDSETVSINGIQLNINTDKYDYRRN